MTRVPILTRGKDGELTEVMSPYDGKIPASVFHFANGRIKGADWTGFCYPADALDLAHEMYYQMELAARDLGTKPPEHASPTTYLCGVAKLVAKKFFREEVLPRRAEYRAIEQVVHDEEVSEGLKAEHNAPEGADAGFAAYAAAAEGYTSELGEASMAPQPLIIQQMADQLPAEESAAERRKKARAELEELLGRLPPDTVAVFRAYLKADGNIIAAAHLLKTPLRSFYREWQRALVAARRVAMKGVR